MLSVLWNRLPLTMTAWVIVGGCSLVRFASQTINAYWRSEKYIKFGDSTSLLTLPQDVQNEIIGHIMTSSTDKELLEASLICKHFYNRISNSPLWLKEILQRFHDNNPDVTYETYFAKDSAWHQTYEMDLLGADKIFSPKLAYFFVTKRSNPRNDRYRDRLTIDPDLVAYRNKNLYVPWLDHDFFRVKTIWRLVKTIIICPNWLHMLVMAKSGGKKHASLISDPISVRRMSKVFGWLSILLSYLPFLDSFLYQYRGSFINLLASKSIIEALSILWNSSGMPFSTCLRILANLLPSLIETCFMSSWSTLIRMTCMLVLYVASFSLSELIKPVGAASTSILMTYIFYRAKKNWINEKMFVWHVGLTSLILLYNKPVQTVVFLLLYFLEFVWLNLLHSKSHLRTTIRPYASKILLLSSIHIVLSNCL